MKIDCKNTADQSKIGHYICVDLDTQASSKPVLYNGYTQVFVAQGANVTHSYLEETGGMVTPGVEKRDDEFSPDQRPARELEAQRPPLADSHLEAMDVHVTGADGAYEGTVMSMGGSGRVRPILADRRG